MECRRSLGDPTDEFRKARMRTQCLDGLKLTRQLGLGQRRVNLVVAELMHKNHRTALSAPELRYEVMKALPGVGRYRAPAERADRVAHFSMARRNATRVVIRSR